MDMKCVRNVVAVNIIENQLQKIAKDFGPRNQKPKKAKDFGLNVIISGQMSKREQEPFEKRGR